MKISTKNFLIRAASALAAVLVLMGLYLSLGVNGLKIIVVFAVFVGTGELVKILFTNESSVFLKVAFFCLTILTFTTSSLALITGTLVFVLAMLLVGILSLLILNKTGELERIGLFQAKATLGFAYMGLIPALVFRILDSPQGVSWFIFLLSVVFSGDTMAYIFGVLIGKNKIMPNVSPKKTWEGSTGGILGSIVAGFICWFYFLHNFQLVSILALAAISGLVAQFGDFFESLLKRVAHVKDSGNIMPGHGGVLDRIDGILYAGPVVFCGLTVLSHFST